MFNEKDYEKITKVINLEDANKFGFRIMWPLFLGLLVPYLIIYWNDIIYNFTEGWSFSRYMIDTLIIIIASFIGIILHELIHAITWMIAAKKGLKTIKFGIIWKTISPYCHCTEPMKIKHYRLGAIMPAIILGVFPLVTSYITGCFLYFFFGFLFILGAIGDFLVIQILYNEKRNDYALDHPTEAGCYVYRKIST
ncbi:MAG: DUF3267 domain-containing protein [Dysgonamonadaceae bacterium]|jgi:hypothetical protein|nr:DUF3267 domain-containing protein [Dysgonamonadaceae bacterium]MDD3309560.1 DUF3267 domain-containing protein [Dysgonamonadaceae bacterium]MDD3900357.1 DUF3267 domain-containing protein [Dysgonamonadaceae bacterium]MDD4399025.1 DUF3267 domain-containing protein [Dysgonamonadaceae bacterium]MEA5082373.1 DUF3267 domain-containing protein [Dysgonamonadaceae bacterium]